MSNRTPKTENEWDEYFRGKPCSRCGTLARGPWKHCSTACKDADAQERRARMAEKRQAKAAARRLALSQNPIAQAMAAGDRDAILAAVYAICTINELGCWIPGLKFGASGDRLIYDQGGYRRVAVDGKSVALHRLTLEASLGLRLGATAAHHICAVRSCCNPEHLQPATIIENNLEMMERHAYRHRIADLEAALKELNPDHPMLWPERWSELRRPLTLF